MDDEARSILANLIETIRVVADQLEPFMPVTVGKIFEMLNLSDDVAKHAPFGTGLKPGHKVNPPTALFPRREKLVAT
jgi:methionyl-tRNA synthetase